MDQEGLDYVDQKILKTMIEVYGGGLTHPIPAGVYAVNDGLLRDTRRMASFTA